jgi:hypothetical protein
MIKPIKILKTNFVFAIMSAALIFTACENDFMQKALSTLSGSDGGPVYAPITWNTDVVYVDPLSGTLSGTVMALLNNGGRRIWFAHEQNNTASKQWEFTGGDANITAGSLALFIAGSPTVSNGDIMTLNFFSDNSTITTTIQAPVPCSFILYPDSLYGADRDAISIATATLNFKIEKPSNTVYAKYILEKKEYGSISVSWTEGSQSLAEAGSTAISDNDTTAAMRRLAGSLAAEAGSAAAVTWANSEWGNFSPINPVGSLSAVSWITSPNLSKGWLPYAKYTIELSPIQYTSDLSPQSPRISAPVEFTSYVGSAAILIQKAYEGGSFATLLNSGTADENSGSVATVLDNLNIPSLLLNGAGGTAIAWLSGSAPTSTGEYSFVVGLGKGADGSPEDTVVGLKAIFTQ